jgi:hypothetical protein
MTGLVAALAAAVRRGRGPVEAGSPLYLASLLQEAGDRLETTSGQAPAAELPESITAREVEILRHIAAGHELNLLS